MTIEQMTINYLNYCDLYQSNGTYRFYKSHLTYLQNYFIQNKIISSDELTKNALTNFIIYEKNNNVSNATINKRILCIKQLFKYNNISTDILDFKKLKENITTFNCLSNTEMNELINYLYTSKISQQNRLIILLLIDTGTRINELLNIKVSNINFYNNTIYLETTKTKTPRYVPFTNNTCIELKQYLTNIKSNQLFNITLSAVESLFQRIKQQLNFKEFHPHTLRHTLASKLHNSGASLFVIQQILGHTNVSTTQRYIHLNLDEILSNYNNIMNV